MGDGELPLIGDWVRFYVNGRFVIGRVEYLKERIGGYTDVYTDCGIATEIVEVRKP